jgi:hypothetical protein
MSGRSRGQRWWRPRWWRWSDVQDILLNSCKSLREIQLCMDLQVLEYFYENIDDKFLWVLMILRYGIMYRLLIFIN